jgi:hypothetical protein
MAAAVSGAAEKAKQQNGKAAVQIEINTDDDASAFH